MLVTQNLMVDMGPCRGGITSTVDGTAVSSAGLFGLRRVQCSCTAYWTRRNYAKLDQSTQPGAMGGTRRPVAERVSEGLAKDHLRRTTKGGFCAIPTASRP